MPKIQTKEEREYEQEIVPKLEKLGIILHKEPFMHESNGSLSTLHTYTLEFHRGTTRVTGIGGTLNDAWLSFTRCILNLTS